MLSSVNTAKWWKWLSVTSDFQANIKITSNSDDFQQTSVKMY